MSRLPGKRKILTQMYAANRGIPVTSPKPPRMCTHYLVRFEPETSSEDRTSRVQGHVHYNIKFVYICMC